jgi:hypothetical protein
LRPDRLASLQPTVSVRGHPIVRVLFGYFRAGPVVHLVLACLFVALGFAFYTSAQQQEREKAAALAAPMPVAVSLGNFGPGDIHAADEVHVIAQINPAYNYELTEEGKSFDTVRYMYVLFGPEDAADTKQARAAILLEQHQLDRFDELIVANVQGLTATGPVFAVNGAATRSPRLASMANDAMAQEGLTKAPEFIFIDPWIDGRAAALAPNALDLLTTSSVIGSPALLSLLLAAFGFRRTRRQTADALAMAAGPIPAALMGTAHRVPAAAAGMPPAAARPAPMSGRKKIGLGIAGTIVLLIVTKQFWVFSLIPLAVFFAMNRDLRKIAQLALAAVEKRLDASASPEAPAPEAPAPWHNRHSSSPRRTPRNPPLRNQQPRRCRPRSGPAFPSAISSPAAARPSRRKIPTPASPPPSATNSCAAAGPDPADHAPGGRAPSQVATARAGDILRGPGTVARR